MALSYGQYENLGKLLLTYKHTSNIKNNLKYSKIILHIATEINFGKQFLVLAT